MSAVNVEEATSVSNAQWQRHLNQTIAQEQHFRWKMIWGEGDQNLSRTAKWTETTEPLLRPPLSEFENSTALSTIAE
jgi:hypothetical protein